MQTHYVTGKLFQKVVCLLFIGMHFYVYPASLILIDGRTCSGKTTTAKCLVDMLHLQGKRAIHISIDRFVKNPCQAYDQFHNTSPFNTEDILDTSSLYDLFHQEITTALEDPYYNFIVVDHCFLYETAFCTALLRFKTYQIFFISIFCSYDKTKERLEKRNSIPSIENRPLSAVDLHFGIKKDTKLKGFIENFHANKTYDLEIDSTNISPEECATKIIEILDSNPTAFQSNYTSDYWNQKITLLYPAAVISYFDDPICF